MFGLLVRESSVPEPGPGQVLVRMRASALNFADLIFLRGSAPQVEDVVPLLDSAGEAAALPCAGLTAWNSILGGPPARRPCLPGETVLVQGTGGVSLFALQFARLAGCRVIATTSTAEKEAFLRRLGADTIINYRDNPHWGDLVLDATAGRGVDLAVEVGGPNTLPQTIRCVRVGGRIALIGIVGGLGSVDYLHLLPVIERALTLFANAMGSRDDLAAMLRAIGQHRLRPVIDREFPFDQAKQALQYFATRNHVGKVVITHD